VVREGRQLVRRDVKLARGFGESEICFVVAGGGVAHSSAQKPAPSVGVSPTRPGSLFVMPPVEVATQSVPSRSSTTQPTVPCGK
jgi:hypothetical protein